MPPMHCETLVLTWSGNSIIGKVDRIATFAIDDTKLYITSNNFIKIKQSYFNNYNKVFKEWLIEINTHHGWQNRHKTDT